MIKGIDHVQLAIPVGGENKARAFYQDVLGLAEVPKPADMAGRGGCWFENEAVKVHVGVELDFRPAQKAHPAFLVTDLDPIISVLRDGGWAVNRDSGLDQYRRIFTEDPFGNRIELMQRL
jgi:catechol 2,3-dioxygenase-like lactoylglutathione lyase family enzyme